MHKHCLKWPIDAHSLILKFWSKMAARWPITFSIYLTYGNLSAALSQTWMNRFHAYWAQLWPMTGPWCMLSKIWLVQYGHQRGNFGLCQNGHVRSHISVLNNGSWICPCINMQRCLVVRFWGVLYDQMTCCTVVRHAVNLYDELLKRHTSCDPTNFYASYSVPPACFQSMWGYLVI